MNTAKHTYHQSNKPFARSGAGYFMKGFELIKTKGIRRFVFVPLMINLIIFSVAFYYMYLELDHYMGKFTQWLPESLTWLTYIIWPFALVMVLVFFSFIFSAVANWLAAPFNGLLAEKLEAYLINSQPPSGGAIDIVKDVPRTLSREWCKFGYYLPRAVGFFILSFIPIIGQVMWFLFVSWMMAIQYKDYAFDNHKVSFESMRYELGQRKTLSFSFGITVAIFSMIPLINLIVMPVAICGATAIWVDHYRDKIS